MDSSRRALLHSPLFANDDKGYSVESTPESVGPTTMSCRLAVAIASALLVTAGRRTPFGGLSLADV